jgi:hypothetical protein
MASHKTRERETLFILMLLATMACTGLGQTDEPDSSSNTLGSAIARIVEFVPPALISGQDSIPSIGGLIGKDDTAHIGELGSMTLLLRNGTVRQYDGPLTIVFDSEEDVDRGGLLAEISRLAKVLFGRQSSRNARLAVRRPSADTKPISVPIVYAPMDGSLMLDPPSEVKWQPIDMITLYRVTIFDEQKLVTREFVNGSSVDPSRIDVTFQPGVDYTLVVEACIQDTYLRSRDVRFKMANDEELQRIEDLIRVTAAEVTDDRLRTLLVAQMYLDYGLYEKYLSELDNLLAAAPFDRTALSCKMLFYEAHQRYDDAIAVAKNLLQGAKL